MPLTFREAEDIVRAIKYKSNFTISIERSFMGDQLVTIVARVPDRDTGVIGKVLLPYEPNLLSHTEMSFVQFIHEALRQFEMHECDEFFLYRGERIYDPHKGEKA